MAAIRLPYPTDPQARQALIDKAAAKLGRYGSFEGTTEQGTFAGSTPIGNFAGAYSSPPGSDVLEIHLTKKPWLISESLIEAEARRMMTVN